MTIGDNVREQAQIWKDAGRQRTKGYYKKGTKLTDKEVFEIFNSVGPQRQTAAKYGIHQAAVSAIKRGKMWRSLTSELRGDQGVL
jgi:propanediol dehydratase small subunit